MPDLSPVVDTHTVTCPFPECTWRERTEIRAEYPPSLIEMFTNLAGQHREHHLGQHTGVDWAAAYEAASQPRRGDDVEAWLRTERGKFSQDHDTQWDVIHDLLTAYRNCADNLVPLGRDVSGGGQDA